MKKAPFLVVLLSASTLATTVRPALSQAASTTDGDAAREISLIQARFDSARAAGDSATVGRLITRSFRFIGYPHVEVLSREGFLKNTQEGGGPTGALHRATRTELQPSLIVDGRIAIRTTRVRFARPDGLGEMWLLQQLVYVRGDDGAWRMASGQASPLYDGPVIDTAMYKRYAGTYELDPEYRSPGRRPMQIVWDGAMLVASRTNGTTSYLFLRSPTDEAVASPIDGQLHFRLGPGGLPVGVSFENNGKQTWSARRTSP